MVMINGMTGLTVKDLWKEVKSEENWLGDFTPGQLTDRAYIS